MALVAGVNMPDHDVLFEQLRTIIRMDGISPHVVLLKSKDCNSGREILQHYYPVCLSAQKLPDLNISASEQVVSTSKQSKPVKNLFYFAQHSSQVLQIVCLC